MKINDSDTDVEIPEAEPLPPLEAAEKTASEEQPSPDASPDKDTGAGEEGEGPPPLPPVLELASSNVATAGGLAYGAAGPAGLVAVGAVAAAGGAAYLAKNARERRAAAAGREGAKGGRFRSLVGRGAGTRGALAGGRGRGGGLRGLSGRARSGAGGPGSARSRLGAGGLGRRGGAPGAGGRTGALSRLGRSAGSASRPGGGLSGSSGGRWGAGGGSGARGLAGASKGTGLLGKSSRLGGGSSGAGALGRAAGRAGTRSGRRGGLFGSARRRPAGRVTAISDPAIPSPSGRPLRGAFRSVRRGVRRGWHHPRMRGGRVKFKRASERTRDYMRKRARRLRTKAFFQNLRGWWDRMRARVRGEERYGPMWWASEAASAMAVAALGPSRRRSSARPPLTGRIIGTSARTPGELTAGTGGARLLAITTGDGEYTVTNKPGEITRAESAAEEMRAALAAFGGADVHMLTYGKGLETLPEVLRAVGTGLQQMSAASEGEQPLNPAVTAYMGQLSEAMGQVAAVADELYPLFREAHEAEIELLERRRPNAHRWDSSRRDS